jgi:hypothetical protein
VWEYVPRWLRIVMFIIILAASIIAAFWTF